MELSGGDMRGEKETDFWSFAAGVVAGSDNTGISNPDKNVYYKGIFLFRKFVNFNKYVHKQLVPVNCTVH